jgi:hypothetical protein
MDASEYTTLKRKVKVYKDIVVNIQRGIIPKEGYKSGDGFLMRDVPAGAAHCEPETQCIQSKLTSNVYQSNQ